MRHPSPAKILLFALLLALGIALLPRQPSAAKPIKFWISNFDGQRFDSRKHKGAIVLSFFFVNCPPCIEEIPALYKLITTEFPQAGLLYVDPLEDDNQETITGFAKKLGVPLKYFYHDSLGRLGKKFYKGDMYFPTIIGLKNGKVLFRINELNKETTEEIRKALK